MIKAEELHLKKGKWIRGYLNNRNNRGMLEELKIVKKSVQLVRMNMGNSLFLWKQEYNTSRRTGKLK